MRLLFLLLLVSLRLVASQTEAGQETGSVGGGTGWHWVKKGTSPEKSAPIAAQTLFEESEEENRDDDAPSAALTWVPSAAYRNYPRARNALPEPEVDALRVSGLPRFLRFRNFRI